MRRRLEAHRRADPALLGGHGPIDDVDAFAERPSRPVVVKTGRAAATTAAA